MNRRADRVARSPRFGNYEDAEAGASSAPPHGRSNDMVGTAHRRRTFLTIPTLVLALAGIAWAAGGGLEPNFGTGGVVTSSLTGSTWALTVASNGKTLVGGYEAGNGWWLQRLNADGSGDAGFGAGGIARLFGGGADQNYLLDLAVDANDRPIAAGFSSVSTISKSGAVTVTKYPTLARFTATGSLDTTFAGTGWFRVAVPGSTGSSEGLRVAVLSDGRILLSGFAPFVVDKKGTKYVRPFVARYSSNGSLDTTFGSGGYAIDSRFAENVADSFAWGLAVQSTGKIVLAWRTTAHRWMITRFLSNGTVDSAFPTISSTTDYVVGLAIDASDRILVTGSKPTASGADAKLVRYGADGALDTSFGAGGTATVHVSDAQYAWTRPIVQPLDGALVFGVQVGSTSPTATTVRVLGDGSLDPSYGSNGVGATLPGFPRCAGLAPDGGILLGGLVSAYQQFVARYAPN